MVKTNGKYKGLEARLGYQFDNASLLDLALRHSSSGPADNQRLEFLGDRVLGLVIAKALYLQFPDMTEGDLAPRYNYLIRKKSCATVANMLRLGDDLYLGRSEAKSGGRNKLALLGDVMEAVIGAVYLDGGYAAAESFVLSNWHGLLHELPEETVDPKTRLQEFVQAKKEPPPTYEIISREGPDHAPEFTVKASACGLVSTGQGSNKRAAEQHAARELLTLLESAK